MTRFKENAPLLIGLAIAVLMILFVAGSIYLPGLFIQPKYDFVYAQGDHDYYYDSRHDQEFIVEDGKLKKNKLSPPQTDPNDPKVKLPPRITPKIYYHYLKENKSRETSFKKASKLTLDPNALSPDGFEVVHGSNSGDFSFFFGGGRDYNALFIRGHNVSNKLNLARSANSDPYLYYNFRFLGWVIPSDSSHE